jgi:hypothetical protein
MTAKPRKPTQLADYASVAEFFDQFAGPFFENRGAIDWFIKTHRRELVRRGALLPREGRNGSLVECAIFQRAVVEILKRRAVARLDRIERRPDMAA